MTLDPALPARTDGRTEEQELRHASRARWRLALVLTALMCAVYFGFILLVAFDKPLLGEMVTPGLTLGILLGAIVIVAACALTGIYAAWANRHDARLARLRK